MQTASPQETTAGVTEDQIADPSILLDALEFAFDEASAKGIEAVCHGYQNPRSWPLRGESEWLIESIVSESGETVAASLADGFDGYRRDGRKNVPLSNEELCLVKLELAGNTKEFDVRKPLPAAVARWMRGIAEKIMSAADRVEAIPDPRPRQLIRRFAAGDPTVKYCERLGLVDTTKPIPEKPWWELQ